MVLQRRQARTSLIGFTEFSFARYRCAPHHRRIAEALEAVERGDIGRLAIFVPPRHGKSELASRRFPAWFMGRNPQLQFISASYNSELAGDFGREVRNIVASPEFRAVFPAVSLAPDSRAQDRWNTAQGGSYVAAGVNTAITGRGADILSIDDPVKDRAEADSQLQRDRTWNWYTSTAYTRLMPGGRIVVTSTRWHEDDLAGRLLAAQATGGDQWHVLELPALDDAGEALWPDAYPVDVLERIRAAIGSRDWSALYQGRPAPDTGDYFRREWLRPVNTVPPLNSLRVYGASDYAVTADGGDWTVHVVVGMDPDGRLWLLDLWRGQASSEVWVDAFCDLVRMWSPIGWAEEGGQIRAGVGPFLERRLRERGAYIGRRQFPTRGDKAVRAQSIRGRMAMDGLHYRADAAWRSDLESELMAFPAGKHDDQVDALGLVGQLLNLMEVGSVPDPSRPKLPLGAITGDMLVERNARGGRI
jgi:predicted phage terminase large subunit-like protein